MRCGSPLRSTSAIPCLSQASENRVANVSRSSTFIRGWLLSHHFLQTDDLKKGPGFLSSKSSKIDGWRIHLENHGTTKTTKELFAVTKP